MNNTNFLGSEEEAIVQILVNSSEMLSTTYKSTVTVESPTTGKTTVTVVKQKRRRRKRITETRSRNYCPHRITDYDCIECYLEKECPHSKYAYKTAAKCEICNKTSRFCIHNKRRYYCVECGGKGICEHKRVAHFCKKCMDLPCEHKVPKRMCEHCFVHTAGCSHKYRRRDCAICKDER